MAKKFNWKIFSVCIVLILSLALSTVSPVLYFIIDKQNELSALAPSWFDGEGVPNDQVGQNGDYYLDTLNGNVYQKKSSVWEVIYTIGKGDEGEQGPAGKDGTAVKTGIGDPNPYVQGAKGDLYLDTDTGDLYEMLDDNRWHLKTNIKGPKGDKGETGATWQVGDKDPTLPQSGVEGKEGDFYLNSSTWDLYKKTAEDWTWVGNIQGEVGPKGQDGATWTVGTENPNGKVTGKNGDLYLNTQTYEIYKCSGGTSWSSVGNIQGIAGPKGDDGKDGATWHFGNGNPSSQVAEPKTGDYYLDEKDYVIYRYNGSSWTNVGSIKGKNGEDGLNGTLWTVGDKSPDGTVPGKQGDLYLDKSEWNIYKNTDNNTNWELVGSIKGQDGSQGPSGSEGKPGKDGLTWIVGTQNPDGEVTGKEGDLYLNTNDWEVYKCNGEQSWTGVGSIKGADGTDGLKGDKGDDGATWQVGKKDPSLPESGVVGKEGDLYLNTDNWNVYKYSGSKWTLEGSIKGKDGEDGAVGTPGKNGATWKVGDQTPQGNVSGSVGDLYLDKTTWTVYQCNGGTDWESLGIIKGNDGATGIQGAKGEDGKDGAPGKNGATWQVGEQTPQDNVSGSVGDLYLNTQNWNVYKCTGDKNWEYVGCIKGTDGEKGPAGEKGADGATWHFGNGGPEKQVQNAKEGDFYLDQDTFDVWRYEQKTWQNKGNIKGAVGQQGPAGSPGKDGITWTIGELDPTLPDSAVSGNEGDIYLNSLTMTLYKHTGGKWQRIGSIKGDDGEPGEAGTPGKNGENGKDADDLYMGYDRYIWRGAERSDWYIPNATAGEDVFEHTTEVAEVMSKYFESDYIDLSSNYIALMPYYKKHIDQTLYSGMELTEITVYAKEAGKLQIGSAKVKDVIDSRTNGTELLVINEQTLTVPNKGKNVIKATLHIDDDETIVLGGADSVWLYYAKDIPVDDEPGNFAVIDKQSHQDLLAKTGTKYNDTLAIQVRMSLTVDVPIFEDLRQHVEEDIGGLKGLTSELRFADEHWGAYMYAYTGQNTNLFEGKTITRIGVPLEQLNRSSGGGLPYLDMYLIPTYKDENGVTPAPDSDDVIAKRKEHSILIDNTLERLEIKSESEYQAELRELENGPTWVDFDCRYVVPDGYTLAFCGDGGGFKWLRVHSNTAVTSEAERLGLAKIPYYTPMNSIAGLGKNKASGDYTDYGGHAEPTILLFDIYYEVEWSPAQQIDRLEELEWEATEMDRLRAKVGGKYISILGDSISTFEGYSNEYETQNSDIKSNGTWTEEKDYQDGGWSEHNRYGNAVAYPRLAEISVEDTWWMRTINQAGLKLCVNNSSAGDLVSVEGSRISSGGGRSAQLHDNTWGPEYPDEKNAGQEADIYPDIVAIYFGINDFTNNCIKENFDESIKEFETNYKLIVDKIMNTYGSKQDFKLFVFTLFPEESIGEGNHHLTLEKFKDEEEYQAALDKYNTVIRSIAQNNRKIEVVDLSRKYHLSRDEFKPYALQDSLHPNERGMRLMSNAFLEELYRVFVGE